MKDQVPRNVLLMAVKVIKQWHDFTDENPPDHTLFQIYYDNSPEMKMIRDVLGLYAKIKDEVISAKSIPVKKS